MSRKHVKQHSTWKTETIYWFLGPEKKLLCVCRIHGFFARDCKRKNAAQCNKYSKKGHLNSACTQSEEKLERVLTILMEPFKVESLSGFNGYLLYVPITQGGGSLRSDHQRVRSGLNP